MITEKRGSTDWEDITAQCAWYTQYIYTGNVYSVKYNKVKKLLWISFLTNPGIYNQGNYGTIPMDYVPSYLAGYTGYNGLLLAGNTENNSGMWEAIVLNGDGEIRSSHSLNAATTEYVAVNAMIPL